MARPMGEGDGQAPKKKVKKGTNTGKAEGAKPSNGNERISRITQDIQASAFREFSMSEVATATKNFSRRLLLGEGRFAAVYRGTTASGQVFAFKRLKEPPREGSHLMVLMDRELRTLYRLHHRSLVQLHGYCFTETYTVLVYELVEGGTLQAALVAEANRRQKQLFFSQRVKIAVDIAEGLEYMHSQGVVHRDIKPENILLTAQRDAKLADFGLVKLLEKGEASAETRLAGTLGYMDPESLRNGRVGLLSDVYALGIVLLTLLTGRGPVVNDTEDLLLAKRLEAQTEGRTIHGVLTSLSLDDSRVEGQSPRPMKLPPGGSLKEKGEAKDAEPTPMGLRRWVMILLKAGEMRTLLDPSLQPLLGPPASEKTKGREELGSSSIERSQDLASVFEEEVLDVRASEEGDAVEQSIVSPLGPPRERGRREPLVVRGLLDLALQCSREGTQGRVQASSVLWELRMILRCIPSLKRSRGRCFSGGEIKALLGERPRTLNTAKEVTFYLGQDPWDGAPCVVEKSRLVCRRSVSLAVPDGVEGLWKGVEVEEAVQHQWLLPYCGIHREGQTVHRVYSLPEGEYQLLDYVLFGRGIQLTVPRQQEGPETMGHRRSVSSTPFHGQSRRQPSIDGVGTPPKKEKLSEKGRVAQLRSAGLRRVGSASPKLQVKKQSSKKNLLQRQKTKDQEDEPAPASPSTSSKAAASSLSLISQCSVVLCITEALQSLHSKGRIHGSLGPGAVLVTPRGEAYLIGQGHSTRGAGGGALSEQPLPGACEGLRPNSGSSVGGESPPESPEPCTPTGAGAEHEGVASDLRALGSLILQLGTGKSRALDMLEKSTLANQVDDDQALTVPMVRNVMRVFVGGRLGGGQELTETAAGAHGVGQPVSPTGQGKGELLPRSSSEKDPEKTTLYAFLHLGAQLAIQGASAQPSLEETAHRLQCMRTELESVKVEVQEKKKVVARPKTLPKFKSWGGWSKLG